MDFNQLMGLYQQSMYGGVDPLSYITAQNYQIANQNNEARYGDILTGRTGIYDRNMARITSLGDQERSDINRRADQNKAAQVADAINRGYGASTVKNSIQNRAEEDRTRALAQFRDQEIMRQINTDSQLAGNVYDFMERRTDQQPNMQNLINVNQALGASGMNYPMYGNYGPGSGGAGTRALPGGNAGGMGNFGPGSGGAGRNGFPASQPSAPMQNFGPGSGGAGYPSYPLPGGGMSTPMQPPQSLYGQGGGYGGGGDLKLQQALRNALLKQIEAGQQPSYNMGGGSGKKFISATPDIRNNYGSMDQGMAPWVNQNISFGGPSVGGAYGVPGYPISLGNYQSNSYSYGSYGGGSRPRQARPSGVQLQRPSAPSQPVSAPRRLPNGIGRYHSPRPTGMYEYF